MQGIPKSMTSFIIDGYNAIHKIPETASCLNNSLEKARKALIDYAARWRDKNSRGAQVIIVFDGKSDEFYELQTASRGIRIVFTKTGEEADDRIADILRSAKSTQNTAVISDDNKVANTCRSFKVKIKPVSFLSSGRLSAAGKPMCRSTGKRQAVSSSRQPHKKLNTGDMDKITRELIEKWVKM